MTSKSQLPSSDRKEEQLSMDLSFPVPTQEPDETHYEALDLQLADLILSLNGDDKNKTLKDCILQVSQHTREGQIALACTQEQHEALLKTEVVGTAGDYKPLILDKGYLYLRRYWQYQQQLSDQINARIEINESTDSEAESIQRLDRYFTTQNDETDWQRVAAQRALSSKFLIISGGPGTGKTTTITRLLCLLIEQKLANSQADDELKILLAAPTGKASIRMLDAINEAQSELQASEEVLKQMPKKASTIHKLLGFMPEKVNFKHNRNHLLNADVVLVDEASMIDIALMTKLVEAVPPNAKLILIGDKDQLSSVEIGSVFSDMCEGLKDSDNLVMLQKNWRFAKDSGIGQLAIASNNGDSKVVLELLNDEEKTDCQILLPSILNERQIPNFLTTPWDNYFKILNDDESTIQEVFIAFNQYRILCALRRGLNGSSIMSNRIETALTQQGFIRSAHNQLPQNWYHGRPVMITQNSYSKGLFNGDTGITLIRNGEVKVYFQEGDGGDYKSLAPVRLPAHETTWAMTIHKSQGSEFDEVALILPHEVMPLLTRQLIYTGITRAKKKVSIIASEDVLKAGIKTEMIQATQIGRLLV